MNRWLQRLAELDGDGALARAQDSVQYVQFGQFAGNAAILNILNKLNSPPVRPHHRRRPLR
jgi:hypothetical protein